MSHQEQMFSKMRSLSLGARSLSMPDCCSTERRVGIMKEKKSESFLQQVLLSENGELREELEELKRKYKTLCDRLDTDNFHRMAMTDLRIEANHAGYVLIPAEQYRELIMLVGETSMKQHEETKYESLLN
jgi:hypothetical protein